MGLMVSVTLIHLCMFQTHAYMYVYICMYITVCIYIYAYIGFILDAFQEWSKGLELSFCLSLN